MQQQGRVGAGCVHLHSVHLDTGTLAEDSAAGAGTCTVISPGSPRMGSSCIFTPTQQVLLAAHPPPGRGSDREAASCLKGVHSPRHQPPWDRWAAAWLQGSCAGCSPNGLLPSAHRLRPQPGEPPAGCPLTVNSATNSHRLLLCAWGWGAVRTSHGPLSVHSRVRLGPLGEHWQCLGPPPGALSPKASFRTHADRPTLLGNK